MRNTLKQAIVLWGMVLLLVLWSVFISPSGVLRWAGAAAIVLAVAALLIYRRRQAWTEMTAMPGCHRCRRKPTDSGSAGLWRSVGAPVH